MIEGKDLVVLQKQNGETMENIKAIVQPDMIFINDSSLPIEEGDHFIRKLPNGLRETYLVLDRGFYDSGYGIKAHYQCEVQKVTTRELEQPKQVIYNLYGANSRVNNNSTDQSINIVEMSSDDLFDEIRKALKENIRNEEERRELREIVNELEVNQGTNKFNQLYTKFVTSAANHMTVISPFIPALSQMLQS
ncbi:hypothetical protein [Peribacillus asahii]|uniref:hypothetical protein n=1 Tax=Peribacillus asahii TaxID=228899 RepID=UPI00207949A2|nr:hypothetical protein [Peribacillus asahii]USK69187.1 hypothetical protein LIS76_16685 [Peribacillus asahii]